MGAAVTGLPAGDEPRVVRRVLGLLQPVSVTDVRAVSPTVVDYTISYDGSSPEAKQITLIRSGSSYLIESDGQQEG